VDPAARPLARFEHNHIVTCARQFESGDKPAHARANDGNTLGGTVA
jgi:hypothetical protein